MMRFGNKLFRDMFDKLLFCLQRGLAVDRQSYPVGYPEDVRVDGHGWEIENDGGDDIGCLPPNSWQPHQLLDIGRNDTLEFINECSRHAHKMLGLVVGIRDAFDIGEDGIRIGGGQRLGCRVGLKKGRGDHVDPLVRTLGRKDNRYQQLVGIGIMKFRFSDWFVVEKPLDHVFVSFLFPHDKK